MAVVRNGEGLPLSIMDRGSGYVEARWGEYTVVDIHYSPNRGLAGLEVLLDSVWAECMRQAPRQVIVLGNLNAKSQAGGGQGH